MSQEVCHALIAETNLLIEQDLIEPPNSEWCSPVVMTRKPDGNYRPWIDFRRVNEVSKKDEHPIPFLAAILDRLKSARYISTLDLNKTYHKIPTSENSRPITALTIPSKGLYQYKRMPFGLTGAPGTFQRLIDKVISLDMRPHVFAYHVDVIVVSETFKEQIILVGEDH